MRTIRSLTRKSEGIHAGKRCMTMTVAGWSERVGIGGFAGGELEQHSRPWLDVQCLGLFLGVPSCPEPQQVAPPSRRSQTANGAL